MKQVIQSARTGKLAVKDVPAPRARPGHLLVRTRASLISAGTERLVVGFAKKNLAAKARARPDLVKKMLNKARRDGPLATMKAVLARLDAPLPLGYSAAGIVEEVGAGLEGRFRVGERVAVAGAGLANHAAFNAVPENLAAVIPENVPDIHACFATLGAIALHAVRNVKPQLGGWYGVIGAGLVGQMAAQFIRLGGGRAVVLDYNGARLGLARQLGAEASCDLGNQDAAGLIRGLTGAIGCDGVVIAAATESSEPFATAAAIARDRATVCLVGLTGTEFPYREFMHKELNIVVSRSYGPGRYDPDFEDRGVKYPPGFVRWTETENLAETLRLMAAGLEIGPLITHRFAIDEAPRAYDLISGGTEPHLGVVLTYGDGADAAPRLNSARPRKTAGTNQVALGLIGAGNYARSVLLPALGGDKRIALHTIVTQNGAAAEATGDRCGFETMSTEAAAVIENPDIDAVIIATRHDSHAGLTARALAAGKVVWVEKPLAIDDAGLAQVVAARNQGTGFFCVGFNRRFAPGIITLSKQLAQKAGPRFLLLRINAGPVPDDSWIHQDGGRIPGEVCHFVDLARFLAGHAITSVQADAARPQGGHKGGAVDDVTATLRFADGSLATIAYTALGGSAAGKERFEVFAGGAVFVLDDFKTLTVTDGGRTTTTRTGGGKGQPAALAAFVAAALAGGPGPIDEAELIETSQATLAILASLRAGRRIDL